MVISERNKMISDICRDHPYWSKEKVAELFGMSRQQLYKVLKSCDKSATIFAMENSAFINIGNEPISATQAARVTKIPYSVIATWVKRGLVKVVSRPEKGVTWNKPVLLDPETLRNRIELYKPHKNKK